MFSFGQLSTEQILQVDSLKLIIENSPHDSITINSLIEWDRIVWKIDPEMDLELNLRIQRISLENLGKSISGTERSYFQKSKGFAENGLGIAYKYKGDYEKAIEYYLLSGESYGAINDYEGIGKSYHNVGLVHYMLGNYDEAVSSWQQSVAARQKGGDQSQMARSLTNIGIVYSNQGDYTKSIEYHMKSLVIQEKLDQQDGVAACLENISILYMSSGDYEKAKEYQDRSLQIKLELGDELLLGEAYVNIGSFHQVMNELDSSHFYYQKALDILLVIKDYRAISSAYNNLGGLELDRNNLEEASTYFTLGLEAGEQIDHNKSIAVSLNGIAQIHQVKNNHSLAIEYAEKALRMAQELGEITTIREASKVLWISYKKKGNYARALPMHELYVETRDSLSSAENHKEVIRQDYQYQYDKQTLADSLNFAQEKELTELANQKKLDHETQQKYLLFGGLGFLIIIAALAFVAYYRKKKDNGIITKQKREVEYQKEIVEEAHKEITDSINYAERIQRSFLATQELLDENLAEYFVYFNPKEAVSGDFYWADCLSNGNFALVNADSTGHGVPGAIMSILNISSIERSVEKGLSKPSEIFNDTRKSIIERLKKDGSPEGGKDGMDASLISLNPDRTKMEYVAANNPIWIIRKGELIDIKSEKMPVGKHDFDQIPFEGGEIALEKGDVIYTLTDGFQDQFGGEKGKKFKVKPLKNLLIQNLHLSMSEQHQLISKTFDTWQGELEQVDDVCLIGIKV